MDNHRLHGVKVVQTFGDVKYLENFEPRKVPSCEPKRKTDQRHPVRIFHAPQKLLNITIVQPRRDDSKLSGIFHGVA